MKTVLKHLSFVLAVLLLLPLAGCAETPVALSYGETVVTTNMYRYWLSSYKGTFMYAYTDMSDTDAFWNSLLDAETTAEDFFNESVLENVKRTLICAELFRRYALTVPESTVAEVDDYIETLINEYADGNKRKFNQVLAEYGINVNMLREIYLEQEKAAVVFSYLYSQGGPHTLSESELDAYFRENYSRVRHIYVNNAYKYKTNDAGYYQYDSAGNVLTAPLSEDELAVKNEKIQKIDEALAAGTAFDEVYKTYSEDQLYVNGYYLTKNTDFIPEIVVAAFTLKIGDTVKLESDYGTHYLMRLPLEDNAYNEPTNADFFDNYGETVANADFSAFLEELLPEVTVYREEVEKYSIRDAAVNYSI